MPTSAELIDAQYEYELARNLLDHNSGLWAIYKMVEEMGEFWEEHDRNDPRRKLEELVDLISFAHSIAGQLCRELDIAYEVVDQMMINTIEKMKRKYPVELFEKHEPEIAMRIAKSNWSNQA